MWLISCRTLFQLIKTLSVPLMRGQNSSNKDAPAKTQLSRSCRDGGSCGFWDQLRLLHQTRLLSPEELLQTSWMCPRLLWRSCSQCSTKASTELGGNWQRDPGSSLAAPHGRPTSLSRTSLTSAQTADQTVTMKRRISSCLSACCLWLQRRTTC